METTLVIIIGIVGVAIGFGVAKFFEKKSASGVIRNAKKEAASIIKVAEIEAEATKKDKLLQAKDKFLELKAEHEQVILGKDKKNCRSRKKDTR